MKMHIVIFFHFLEKVFWLQFTKKDQRVIHEPFLLLLIGRLETFHHSQESLCHPIFWELSSENVFQKLLKNH